MMIKWFLQEDVFNENLELLTTAIQEQGMEYEVVKYILFTENGYSSIFNENACVICYGSINFINQVKRNEWTSKVWFNEKNLECTTYYAYYGEYLINQDYTLLPFAEFQRRRAELFKGRDKLFIRPNSNMKEFLGNVALMDEVESIFKYLDIKPSTLVVCAPYKDILQEWRFVIADRKVITGSQYRKKVSKYIPFEAQEIAEKIAQVEWRPSRVFIVDIGATEKGFGLVEIGSFNCAGLYDCDRSLIVKTISKVAEDEHNEF
jgi:hypothetical protein